MIGSAFKKFIDEIDDNGLLWIQVSSQSLSYKPLGFESWKKLALHLQVIQISYIILQHFKSNIKVFVRCRPLRNYVTRTPTWNAVTFQNGVIHIQLEPTEPPKLFPNFTGVFDPKYFKNMQYPLFFSATQEEVYNKSGRPYINHFLSGYNGILSLS